MRNRRASIVREVSQSEHEQISTRVVTNYNHMHALSIHYYEVVQAFRVTTQLERAERCLFVPLQLLDFNDAAIVDRWRLRARGGGADPARAPAADGRVRRGGDHPADAAVTPGRIVVDGASCNATAGAPGRADGAAAGGPRTAMRQDAPDAGGRHALRRTARRLRLRGPCQRPRRPCWP